MQLGDFLSLRSIWNNGSLTWCHISPTHFPSKENSENSNFDIPICNTTARCLVCLLLWIILKSFFCLNTIKQKYKNLSMFAEEMNQNIVQKLIFKRWEILRSFLLKYLEYPLWISESLYEGVKHIIILVILQMPTNYSCAFTLEIQMIVNLELIDYLGWATTPALSTF